MKKTLLICLLIPFLIPINVRGQNSESFNPEGAYYLWPTEASPYLSSTFGETRSAHFHAALDIKTWGQRGYEVYATRDGIVDRIAIGPKGYGKVVYLKHKDGSYSVYAHLLSFNEELQQLADSIRFAEDYQFELERFMGWRQIEVDQGDVIGYSGASGIGPPHLHFELRTPSHKPFNPLLTNLSVADNIAPKIRGLSVEPLSPHASVEGENKVYTKRAWGKKGKYELGTINVSGPVGLGINVFDQSNRVNNSYAVYEISMEVNGQELFSSRIDSFSYSETDQMFVDRIYPLLQKYDEGYQRLYIADGNTLPFYETSPTKGVIDLDPGSHNVTIRTSDYYGNTSTASLQLNVRKDVVAPLKSTPKKYSTQIISPPRNWHWFPNWMTLPEEQFNQLTIGIANPEHLIKHENGIAINLREFNNLFLSLPEEGPVVLRRIDPNSTNIISSVDSENFAVFPENSTYDTVSVGMAVQKITPDSITLNMLPEIHPIRNSYKFHIQRDSALTDTKKMSFYRWDHDDSEWEIVPTGFSNNHIIGEAESLGTFTMLKDTTAPVIENPRLVQRPRGLWLIMVDAEDDLSGIDYERTNITVNGMRGIAEYEPYDDNLVYYHPEFNPSSSMEIEITVFDKMGNKRFSTFEIHADHQSKK